MRLDLFLKASRIIPRRTLAQQFCDKGAIRVNGLTARSSKSVTAGDEIEIKRKDRILVVKVLEIPRSKQVSKEAASQLFSVVSETQVDDGSF